VAHDIFSGQDVAVKLEPTRGAHCTLEHEFHVYKKLAGGPGISIVHSFGIECGYNALVMDCLGPSLEQLFSHCHFQFSVKTVFLLASQLVSQFDFLHFSYLADACYVKICRLRHIHSRNFIHCDLKPSNIIVGVGKHSDVVYIIDFGLSRQFRHPDTYLHIPYNEAQGIVGTATFASINSHLGSELGRRDDLESLGYILIYFLRGSLPWQGLDLETRDLVAESKQTTSANVLCQGLPVQLRTFLEYSRSLSFTDKPNYNYLHNLFDASLSREGSGDDLVFDWDGSDI
jgi:serine/threonine protein kinase